MTERARILKFEPEAPPSQKTPSGYAAVPREVTRKTDLSGQAHKVLTALLGLCYGDDRQTRASVRQISAACGMPRRTVNRYLAELIHLRLIDRRHKLERPGGVVTTFILCHPKDFVLSNDPCINWRVKTTPTIVPNPRQLRRDPAPTTARQD